MNWTFVCLSPIIYFVQSIDWLLFLWSAISPNKVIGDQIMKFFAKKFLKMFSIFKCDMFHIFILNFLVFFLIFCSSVMRYNKLNFLVKSKKVQFYYNFWQYYRSEKRSGILIKITKKGSAIRSWSWLGNWSKSDRQSDQKWLANHDLIFLD